MGDHTAPADIPLFTTRRQEGAQQRPESDPTHPLGCRRRRISDRIVFDKQLQVLRSGCFCEAIADSVCSATTIRNRRDEWIRLGPFARLKQIALDAYDRIAVLALDQIAVDVGPLYRRVQRKIELEATQGLSVGVRAVLDLLRERGPMTVPQMGRAQSLSRQFVQRVVNDAVARKLVESIPNPAHRRSSLIRLTHDGHAAITAIAAHEHALLRQAVGDLTDTDVAACVRVLGRMVALFDDVDVSNAEPPC